MRASYTAYYGYHEMHSRTDTARGLLNYLKRIRNKVDMLIDCLEIRDMNDVLVFGYEGKKFVNTLYNQTEVDLIFEG